MWLTDLFKKYKIKAKKLYTIIALSVLEIVVMLYFNSWVFTPAIFAVLLQFFMILENKDIWKRLTDDEKKELTLSEDEIDNFVKGIADELANGITVEEILITIKKD